MQKLLTLSDKDIFPNVEISETITYEFRLAVKVIIFDTENKIALVGRKFRLLPGGGVEEGENLENAARREALEEVGCDIKVEREIAVTEEFRAQINRQQETHFFVATIVGKKGNPQTIQEDEQGIQVSWHTLADAITLLEKEVKEIPFKSYNSCFNVRTHLAVLKTLQNSGE
jgi:ADP-ribose pyrophosphatase YjhB (NUDIX family)